MIIKIQYIKLREDTAKSTYTGKYVILYKLVEEKKAELLVS
jgi:hypothetical protein